MLTVLAVAAAAVIAAGGVTPKDVAMPVAKEPAAENCVPDSLPAGPMFKTLTPEETGYDPVAVPEPVWASVLAACAVSLLRRGRRY